MDQIQTRSRSWVLPHTAHVTPKEDEPAACSHQPPFMPFMNFSDSTRTTDRDLKTDLKFSINNPGCSDVTFVCKDGVRKHAYRSILALRSDMFNSMLYGKMIESKSTEIPLPSTTSAQLQIILEYCYTDDTPSLSLDNAVHVFEAAEYFLLPRLQQFVVNHVDVNLHDYETAGIILSDAVRIAESSPMKDILLTTIRKYFLAKPLEYGMLRTLSREGLEAVLLDQAAVKACPTDAYTWLLCIVDWACDAIGDDSIPEPQRVRILSALDIDCKLSKPLASPLTIALHIPPETRRHLEETISPFFRFVHFDQICSHRLVAVMDVLDFVPTNILCVAFRRNVVDNKVCPPSWPHGNGCVWDREHVGPSLRLSTNATLVEYHPDKRGLQANAHQSVTGASPLTPDAACEWDVVVHSVSQGNGGIALGIATKMIVTDQNYVLVSWRRVEKLTRGDLPGRIGYVWEQMRDTGGPEEGVAA
ncbi:hypothetical protein BC936DRAFT_148028 [Jimgerdemannia flammicorona]|uniref:BTB domain-containing protein n=1 Tax=Jimgerdemannia flammicorona TaxID=994334 RepID=A0A433D3X3_9FUNG|nr:hypothetical protein BC936DRAFT_148028 [Jimgerdemannia flammicorona]